MRYPAAEKLEIIRLVEQSPLPVRHTLAKLGIPCPGVGTCRFDCARPTASHDT